jgi:hypothetical protein
LVKIHWRMLILECSQGCYAVKIWPQRDIVTLPSFHPSVLPSVRHILVNTLGSTSFNGLWPNLVKIHWRMLILECSQGCYAVKIWPLDLWPWKSIGFQTLLRTITSFNGFWPILVHT